MKTSEVQDTIRAYREVARRCGYALHLRLTEAGSGAKGVVSGAAALAVLLQDGIGDTIRISLTPKPGTARAAEVEACRHLLQAMGIRQFSPSVTSCPGCGRTTNDSFQRLADEVEKHIASNIPSWKRLHRGVENMKIAVMGCVVNGPGEASYADIALSLPGKSEEPIATVFVRGKLLKTLRGGDLRAQFLKFLDDFVAEEYPICHSESAVGG